MSPPSPSSSPDPQSVRFMLDVCIRDASDPEEHDRVVSLPWWVATGLEAELERLRAALRQADEQRAAVLAFCAEWDGASLCGCGPDPADIRRALGATELAAADSSMGAPPWDIAQLCDDSTGPNGIGGPCVLPAGHPHADGIGGTWPAPRGVSSEAAPREPGDPGVGDRRARVWLGSDGRIIAEHADGDAPFVAWSRRDGEYLDEVPDDAVPIAGPPGSCPACGLRLLTDGRCGTALDSCGYRATDFAASTGAPAPPAEPRLDECVALALYDLSEKILRDAETMKAGSGARRAAEQIGYDVYRQAKALDLGEFDDSAISRTGADLRRNIAARSAGGSGPRTTRRGCTP